MSHHLTEHETSRRKAWVDFMISVYSLPPDRIVVSVAQASQLADKMLMEYDQRFKCPYSLAREDGPWN